MEGLKSLEGLDILFEKIANALGIAIDTVQANGMDYILEYGKYALVKNITSDFVFWGFIFALLCLLGCGVIIEECKVKAKTAIACTIVLWLLLTSIVSVLPKLIVFLTSPMMYSIEQAMKLLN